jgi:hypothetical protein
VIVDVPVGVATRLTGVVGETLSIATIAVAVLVPFALPADKVYVVVAIGFTVIEPTSVVVLIEPGVIVIEVALLIFHESVEVPAERTIEGDAVKEEMTGGAPTLFMFTVIEALTVLLEVSVESAQSVVEPFASEAVSHDTEYELPDAIASEPIRVLDAKLVP